MYLWIKFIHVLGALMFMLAHGASAKVALRLRHEKDHERLAVLLEHSVQYINLAYISLLVMLAGGIVAGFKGQWWSSGWIWVALGLILVLMFAMYYMATMPLSQLRDVLGGPYLDGKLNPAKPRASAEQIATRLAAVKPVVIASMGLGGLLLIVWLMVLKPF